MRFLFGLWVASAQVTGTFVLLLVKRCSMFTWIGLLWTFALQVPVTLPGTRGSVVCVLY